MIKRRARMLYVLVVVCLCITACETEPSELSANFFKDTALDIAALDTVTVRLSTIRYEHLPTDGATRLLIGRHDDETLGAVSSAAYFEVSAPSSTSLTADNSTYNYLALVLKYDDYWYYDTTATTTFNVYRVNEKMELDDDGVLYNTSSFDLYPSPLGAATFSPRPHSDSVVIRLDDALGQELYNKILAQSSDIFNSTNFLRYIRGLAVLPDASANGSLLGFGVNATLRLYYVDRSKVPSDRTAYLAFPLNSEGIFFNQIQLDTDGTPLAGKLNYEEDRLEALHTNNQSYMQGGTGLALRADFPYIKNLTGRSNFYIISAALQIYPTRSSYSDKIPLPQTLTAWEVYPGNGVYSQLSSGIGVTTETELPRDAYYALDVTTLVQTLVSESTSADNQHGVLFQLPSEDYARSISRVIAGAAKTKLTIYYTTIKQ